MAKPVDLVLPLLREIQADIAAFRKETNERLQKLETGQRNIRSALAGDTVLSRMLVGEYEERIDALERKVEALEERK
jgi:polyhydroxyalkanoate synthesis regulator phasin